MVAKYADGLMQVHVIPLIILQGLHIDEIAKLANLNTNRLSKFYDLLSTCHLLCFGGRLPGAIARILRLLATEHVLTEVSPDVFAINRISSVIDSGKSVEEIRAKYVSRFSIPCKLIE